MRSRSSRAAGDGARAGSAPITALAQWRARALAVPGEVLSSSVPLAVLLIEAGIAADFVERRWKGTAELPGLESAVNETFTAATGRELLTLVEAAEEADLALVRLPVRSPSPAPEGRQLLRAILATLTWHLDGGEDSGGRAQLDALRAAHAKIGRSALALATALEESARFAAIHRAAIAGLGGFDPAQIEAALLTARSLRERARSPRAQPEAQREALALRNKLVALIRDRLATVRAAARFVFRDHPAIVREVTSAHERKRRKRGRAKKKPPAASG